MKKIMLIVLMLAGAVTFASAQYSTRVKKTPEERAARQTKMLQKKLNLNASQAEQINAILLEKITKASEPKMKGVKGGHLAKMEIAADADKKINTVLTPDQQRQYALMEEKVKERAIERKKNKAAQTMQTTPAR